MRLSGCRPKQKCRKWFSIFRPESSKKYEGDTSFFSNKFYYRRNLREKNETTIKSPGVAGASLSTDRPVDVWKKRPGRHNSFGSSPLPLMRLPIRTRVCVDVQNRHRLYTHRPTDRDRRNNTIINNNVVYHGRGTHTYARARAHDPTWLRQPIGLLAGAPRRIRARVTRLECARGRRRRFYHNIFTESSGGGEHGG